MRSLAWTGTVNENVAPPPNVRRTEIVPPWASTIDRQIASPMPDDPRLSRPRHERLEQALARPRVRCPRPWSETSMRTASRVAGGRDPHVAPVAARGGPRSRAGSSSPARAGRSRRRRAGDRRAGRSATVTSRSRGARLRTRSATSSAHVDGLALGRERPGLDAAEAEQVGDEAVEPVHLVAHRGEQLDAGDVVVLDAVAQVGGDGADRRERRAEVVGHGAQQRAALAVERLELLGAGGAPREVAALVVELRDALVERAYLLGRPRSTSVRRRTSRVTSWPTSNATMTNATSSVPSSTLAMSSPPYGRMNATLSVIAAATAVTIAATAPPTIAAPTTTTTRMSATVAEVSWSRTGRSASPIPTVAATPSTRAEHRGAAGARNSGHGADLDAILATGRAVLTGS